MSDDANPYATPSVAIENPKKATYSNGYYGGIGRLAYFGYTFLAALIYQVAIFGLVGLTGGGEGAVLLFLPLLLIYLGALMFIVAQRMINCGYSPWWCIGIIVPLVNILVGARALCCPEGYADHKKLDTPGKVLIGLFLGLFALVVLFAVLASVG